VIVFNKQEAIDLTDSGDNFKKRNSVVYARNISFKIAAYLGLINFVEVYVLSTFTVAYYKHVYIY
jgi:hypothetical protein